MACTKFSVLKRFISTNSIKQQMVKSPIQIFGIDGRYAMALYSAASKQNVLDAVEKDLVKFQSTVKADHKLREFIVNPIIKRQLKADALQSIAKKVSLNPQISNLLQMLAENGRLRNIDGITNAFKDIMSAHRGEVICQITTAKELSGEQRKQLETVLKSFLKGKQTLHLSTQVDPSIIGGMLVSIGDRYVDMSVASKIKKYTELITAAV